MNEIEVASGYVTKTTAYIYLYTYVPLENVPLYICAFMCVPLCRCLYMCAFMYVRLYVCPYMCTFVYVPLYMCLYIFAFIYVPLYIFGMNAI